VDQQAVGRGGRHVELAGISLVLEDGALARKDLQ
jgi:hypothetical protein